MTAAPRLRLKRSSGWFAAGREVESALHLLTEPAFRLFMWLCLHADRYCGSVYATASDLAPVLGRTLTQIEDTLRELLRRGVCSLAGDGALVIADRFWPYERACDHGGESAAFVAQVKKLFLARRCVRAVFTHADEQFALRMRQQGFSILEVEHVILLGSLRKYAALINNGRGTPITSLTYFTGLLDEVREQIAPDYWEYVAAKVRNFEHRWLEFDVRNLPANETK